MSDQSQGAESTSEKPSEESRKPQVGDSKPAPVVTDQPRSDAKNGAPKEERSKEGGGTSSSARRRRRRKRAAGEASGSTNSDANDGAAAQNGGRQGQGNRNRNRSKGGRAGRSRSRGRRSEAVEGRGPEESIELSESQLRKRRGRSRKGKPVGRYLMVVSKQSDATHISVLEGRHLIEYYVSRPSDEVFQIHGNIYLGRVQNVLPGMEAAFVDIGTPKNAVLYRGDVQFNADDYDKKAGKPKIEQMISAKQMVLCQVTKNPIAHKGARLTMEVSIPGRFVVLVPNSDTYGISKRLPDKERKRLRQILDKARPKKHGLIVRTAAENVTAAEIRRDVTGLVDQWNKIEALAKKAKRPIKLYQEPDMSVRVIREEFNRDYRGVIIDDPELHSEVAEYVSVITPALADRVEYYDTEAEKLSVFDRYHVHEQLHRALDRKVWLPSGGSLIIEHTEALTVIDVNTGKNVGKSSLEETVYQNNLEAAEEIAHQLRLRDIGGIIVIDFVDMENRKNRDHVIKTFRSALSRDKTRTQVFDISDLGLVEMTRKRIGEGLLDSLSTGCEVCGGRGITLTTHVLDS